MCSMYVTVPSFKTALHHEVSLLELSSILHSSTICRPWLTNVVGVMASRIACYFSEAIHV